MARAHNTIARYARRAEELRAISDSVKDPETRKALLEWAATYDRLISRAVELVTIPTGSQPPKVD